MTNTAEMKKTFGRPITEGKNLNIIFKNDHLGPIDDQGDFHPNRAEIKECLKYRKFIKMIKNCLKKFTRKC